jgi:hypothetical protein
MKHPISTMIATPNVLESLLGLPILITLSLDRLILVLKLDQNFELRSIMSRWSGDVTFKVHHAQL